jgi:hypothetical protein
LVLIVAPGVVPCVAQQRNTSKQWWHGGRRADKPSLVQILRAANGQAGSK